MKVTDEVQYDIFRRALEATVIAGGHHIHADEQAKANREAVDNATKLTDMAVKRLLEMKVIE